MDVTLVNMPWASVEYPSLACGILRASVAGDGSPHRASVLDANIDFFDWMSARLGTGVREYDFFSLESYFQGCGDWVFSSALYGDPDWRVEEFRARRADDLGSERLELCLQLHRLVPEWIDEYARSVVDEVGDLVGFTTTFQQNTASLALARALKRIKPGLWTVFGGANCDGVPGAGWHRNFDFLDYVVRGEGEAALPALVECLEGRGDVVTIPGLCWRDSSGASTENAMTAAPLAPAHIVSPDFDGYLDRFNASAVADSVEPKLVVEGARGCWWGEKHHCTFCGLNGSFMQFRSKSPERFHDEIVTLASRYRVLDMYIVDNIIDMDYLRTVVPRIREEGFDLRLQCEIKSNLRYDQLRELARAGFIQVQPGIENLSSRVLKIMDKGVDGCQNVRMLRDAESLGLTVMWNYLYGFPGEQEADYTSVVAQFPALSHLSPMDGAGRLALERFSPYFDEPALGFERREADDQYAITYDLPQDELRAIAYLFATRPAGIGGDVEKTLVNAVRDWTEAYAHSRLGYLDRETEIVVRADRPAFSWTELVLSARPDVELFHALHRPRSLAHLEQRFGGGSWLHAKLDEWLCAGLVFTDADRYVHVVPQDNNQELLRLV